MKSRIFVTVAACVMAVSPVLAQQDAPQVVPASAAYQAASKIVIPRLDFRGATVREALEFLRVRAQELDPKAPPAPPEIPGLDVPLASRRGVNILLKFEGHREPAVAKEPVKIPGLDVPGVPPPVKEGSGGNVTLTLKNVPLNEVVRYVAYLADCRVRWDKHAVVVIGPEPGKPAPAKDLRPELKVAPGVAKSVLEKLNTTVVPKVHFIEATPREAFDFVMQRAKTLSPDGTGISFIWKGEQPADPPRVTYFAENLSLLEVIRYTAELSGLDVTIDPFAVVLSSSGKP